MTTKAQQEYRQVEMQAVPTDEELMARVYAGSHAAYEELYARWYRPIFSFLLRRTGSRSKAEDALQETFLRLFRYRRRYQLGRPFRAWIFAIAANAGRDARRPEPEIFWLEGPGDSSPELRSILVSALHQLKAADRRLLLLAAEGFEGPEIAQMLDLRPGAVRMRLSRARERVRAVLEEAHA
jgi:DNA-directed RNA polymerase specialized sigma24 family protein